MRHEEVVRGEHGRTRVGIEGGAHRPRVRLQELASRTREDGRADRVAWGWEYASNSRSAQRCATALQSTRPRPCSGQTVQGERARTALAVSARAVRVFRPFGMFTFMRSLTHVTCN